VNDTLQLSCWVGYILTVLFLIVFLLVSCIYIVLMLLRWFLFVASFANSE